MEEALCFGWIDSTIKAGEGVMWRRFSMTTRKIGRAMIRSTMIRFVITTSMMIFNSKQLLNRNYC